MERFNFEGLQVLPVAHGMKVALEDYYEFTETGEKKNFFTFDEAQAIQRKLPDGWRIPTQADWLEIVWRFGNDGSGWINGSKLTESLAMEYVGIKKDSFDLIYDTGSRAVYWSSTEYVHPKWAIKFGEQAHCFEVHRGYADLNARYDKNCRICLRFVYEPDPVI